jgi:hypothetical protein
MSVRPHAATGFAARLLAQKILQAPLPSRDEKRAAPFLCLEYQFAQHWFESVACNSRKGPQTREPKIPGVSCVSQRGHQSMQLIRKVLGWIFAITSLIYLADLYRIIRYAIHQKYPPSVLQNLLIAASFSVVVAAISGVAWWTIWKRTSSARGWAIAASIAHILIFLRQFLFPSRAVWGHHAGALVIGIVGLIAFLGPEKQSDSR